MWSVELFELFTLTASLLAGCRKISPSECSHDNSPSPVYQKEKRKNYTYIEGKNITLVTQQHFWYYDLIPKFSRCFSFCGCPSKNNAESFHWVCLLYQNNFEQSGHFLNRQSSNIIGDLENERENDCFLH